MKKLLTILILTLCCSCYADGFYFAQPVIDTTKLSSVNDSSLMHFENNYFDIAGNTWTESNANMFFTDQNPKFGNYSFNCYADSITSAILELDSGDLSSFNVGAGDFTWEFFYNIYEIADIYRPSSVVVGGLYMYLYDGTLPGTMFFKAGGNALTQFPGSDFTWSPTITFQTSSGIFLSGGSAYVSQDTWVHLCVERVSGVVSIYIDGVLKGSNAYATTVNPILFARFIQLNSPSGTSFSTKTDEFRFTKGAHVYGGPFTPPTQPFGPEIPPAFKFATDGELKLAP